jgi:histidinol phosphatase-like PHP family hydrolase
MSEDGSLRIDLHLHTLASRDCLSHPEEVLERARATGLHRIAVTDHDRLGAALRHEAVDDDAHQQTAQGGRQKKPPPGLLRYHRHDALAWEAQGDGLHASQRQTE